MTQVTLSSSNKGIQSPICCS